MPRLATYPEALPRGAGLPPACSARRGRPWLLPGPRRRMHAHRARAAAGLTLRRAPSARAQVAQVADVVPLMYGGFLAFFLGLTVFFVRRPGARRCGGPHAPRPTLIRTVAHACPHVSASAVRVLEQDQAYLKIAGCVRFLLGASSRVHLSAPQPATLASFVCPLLSSGQTYRRAVRKESCMHSAGSALRRTAAPPAQTRTGRSEASAQPAREAPTMPSPRRPQLPLCARAAARLKLAAPAPEQAPRRAWTMPLQPPPQPPAFAATLHPSRNRRTGPASARAAAAPARQPQLHAALPRQAQLPPLPPPPPPPAGTRPAAGRARKRARTRPRSPAGAR